MISKSTFYYSVAAGALALAAFSVSQAQAAGFYIQEQSVSGLGSAFSGSTTNINDASTVYFNPAGMTKLEGIQTQAGAHLLIPRSKLRDQGSTSVGGAPITGGNGGNPYDPTPVPNGFATYQINDQLWAGIGVTAPFGLANEYDKDWFGRYDSIKTELKVIDIQPSIAYKVNDQLSLGAGVNVLFADAELTNAIFAGAGTEGVSNLKGDDWAFGYTLGVQYRPIESTTFGLSYRSAVSHTLEGRAKATGTTVADFSVKAKADLDLPDMLTFGASHKLDNKWTIQGQATWFGWNNFEDITATLKEPLFLLGGAVNLASGDELTSVKQGYKNTWAFSVGAEYEHSDEWTFRGGVQFDQTPTTNTYRTSRTPDGDRTWLSGGATYKINDQLSLDMAATYIWIDDGKIDVTRNNSFNPALATDVKAKTSGNVGIVALGLSYKF
jgi:long-chain fatty acid transport protein